MGEFPKPTDAEIDAAVEDLKSIPRDSRGVLETILLVDGRKLAVRATVSVDTPADQVGQMERMRAETVLEMAANRCHAEMGPGRLTRTGPLTYTWKPQPDAQP